MPIVFNGFDDLLGRSSVSGYKDWSIIVFLKCVSLESSVVIETVNKFFNAM